MLKFMNKNKILSGGGKNLTGGGKWGWRGREVGGEGEGSGVKGGGKWGLGTPLSTPSFKEMKSFGPFNAIGYYELWSLLAIITTVNVLKLRTLKNNYFFRCS